MKKGLVFVVVLVMAASAQAAWVVETGTSVIVDGRLRVKVIPMGTNNNPLCGPVDMYQVNLNALDPADIITAVDVDFIDCDTKMYQSGFWNVVPVLRALTPDMLVASALTDPTLDSHFLLNALGTDWSDGNAVANEDNDWTCGTTGAGETEGWGTTLNVLAFISAPARAQDLPFAWITVPAGAQMGAVRLTGAASNGVGDIFSFGDTCDDGIPIPIPEPATMGLLVLGGLAVVARKRR
jgi:hypothetical protein